MLMIRLQRVGRRNDPSFRVIVTEKARGPKSNRAIETLGWYNPHADTKQLKSERVQHWMEKGAQVSGTVYNILVDEKLVSGKKINVLPQKKAVVKEGAEEAETGAQGTATAEADSVDAGEAEGETAASEGSEAASTQAEEEVNAANDSEPQEENEKAQEEATTDADEENSSEEAAEESEETGKSS